MANWASDGIKRIKATWSRLGKPQRWLAAGFGLSLAAAAAMGVFLNRPQWVVLVSQADPKDAAAIVARLQELKVPFQPTGDGYTIMVPKTEQYTAKLALAESGLPRGGSVGMELFDNPSLGSTDFDQQVNYLRAQQGELERALTRMSQVQYANVKLAIPDRSVFVRDQKPVTAAVLVQPRNGQKLTPEQVVGIVNFVAGSVQGLSPENVKVVDQTGRLLSNGAAGADGSLDTDADQTQRQLTLQRNMEQRVQTLLEPIFGAGNVVARVNLEVSLEATRVENQTVAGSTPKSTETVRQVSQGSKAGTGAASTDPSAPPVYQGQAGNDSAGGDAWQTKTITTYDTGQRKEVTVTPPGGVKRISVGIAVNRPDLTPAQIQQIQETVAGATGAQTSAISVTAMAFNTTLPQGLSASSRPVQTTPLVVGGGVAAALVLAGLLLTRRRKVAGEEADELALAGVPELPPVGSILDEALGREHSLGSPPSDPGAAADAADQTPAQRLEVIMAARPKRQMILDGQPVDETLKQHLDELVESSPEACAEMIKQWLKGVA